MYSGLDGYRLRIRRHLSPHWTKIPQAVPKTPDRPTLYPRFAATRVRAALADTPVVIVSGPRQCGKTTLVRDFVTRRRVYVSLDDESNLAAALGDPTGFVRGLGSAVIDEVQRAPALLRTIKKAVDDDRRPGQFLVTGSADLLGLAGAVESLAGRMEIVALLPLSQAEIFGRRPRFLDRAFDGRVLAPAQVIVAVNLVRLVLTGGYPEMLRRPEGRRREVWARDYVDAIVKRDVQDVAVVQRLAQMPQLLRVLAHHSGKLTNFAQISGQLAIDEKTTRRYVTIFERLFLVQELQPWLRNRLSRLIKTPKLHFLDSGLLAVLLGASMERVAKDREILGPLFETFVAAEIAKQLTWIDRSASIFHYRDKDQAEVDVVIEDSAGTVVGIEVKAGATVGARDFNGLRRLQIGAADQFAAGIVLYDGDTVVPFGERLFAAPISSLWS